MITPHHTIHGIVRRDDHTLTCVLEAAGEPSVRLSVYLEGVAVELSSVFFVLTKVLSLLNRISRENHCGFALGTTLSFHKELKVDMDQCLFADGAYPSTRRTISLFDSRVAKAIATEVKRGLPLTVGSVISLTLP